MIMDSISRTEALVAWGQRFTNSGLSDAEIVERFEWLQAGGFLDFCRDADGELRVTLTGRKKRHAQAGEHASAAAAQSIQQGITGAAA
jgi:hypothetical protein